MTPMPNLSFDHPFIYAVRENTTGAILFIPNRSLEKVSCHFLMTAIRKTALYMLDL